MDETQPPPDHPSRGDLETEPLDVALGVFLQERDMPRQIGKYRILGLLGEGGMGTVYLAERSLGDKVALKVIKPGMDSKAVLHRFEVEKHALARMNHPSIAKVLEAGTTDRGQPYFVMEYVKGIPITEHCDKHRVTISDRVKLYQQVCSAVQHAHQKGIIHRDLKPSNVLVSVEQGPAVPKIIDFGVARPTDGRLTDGSMMTEQGSFIGTPEYMSPEQAEMGAQDIDTRTDIYSLGIMLYEALVGEVPFPRIRENGYQEIRRKIIEDDPARPSTRLPESGVRLDAVARHRGTDPKSLMKRIKHDLDWIVMMAIEKDRTRRYQTANALAADLQRHLDHVPVIAGPPSVGYRMGKFVRRYRLQVTAAAAVLLALVGGLAVSYAFYRESETNLQRFEILSIGQKVEKLQRRADRLYPAFYQDRERMLQEMEEWMSDAEGLLAELPSLERSRDELREEAEPYSDGVQEQEPERQALVESQAQLQTNLELLDTQLGLLQSPTARDKVKPEILVSKIGRFGHGSQSVQDRLDEVTQRLKFPVARSIYTFGDDDDQFLHDAETELLHLLETFKKEAFDVAERMRWASWVEELSIDDHADRWQQTISDIKASPLYGGWELVPQVGLVPIGKNPQGLFEFYHLRSAWVPESGEEKPYITVPRRNAAGTMDVTEEMGLIFVLIPGVDAMMGPQNYVEDPLTKELVHQRNESFPPFFLSKYEMTQAQWQRVTGGSPSFWAEGSEGLIPGFSQHLVHPVESLDLAHSKLVLDRLGLRLPRWAEWMYAATSGDPSLHNWDAADPEHAPYILGHELGDLAKTTNLADQTLKDSGAPPHWKFTTDLEDGNAVHAMVGSFDPNGFGLYDVVGNVWEWVDEWKLDGTYMVLGGAWLSSDDAARVSYRFGVSRDFRDDDLGVRPARSLDR